MASQGESRKRSSRKNVAASAIQRKALLQFVSALGAQAPHVLDDLLGHRDSTEWAILREADANSPLEPRVHDAINIVADRLLRWCNGHDLLPENLFLGVALATLAKLDADSAGAPHFVVPEPESSHSPGGKYHGLPDPEGVLPFELWFSLRFLESETASSTSREPNLDASIRESAMKDARLYMTKKPVFLHDLPRADSGTALIGWYDPREQSVAEARKSMRKAIEARLDEVLEEIARVDRERISSFSGPDVRNPKVYDWLVRYQVLGESANRIAERATNSNPERVMDQIEHAAKLVGLELRDKDKGGRPRRNTPR